MKRTLIANTFLSLFLLIAAATCSAQGNTPATEDWHVSVSPYLWLPGLHGIAGVDNRTVSVHASPGDLLSNFRFGLMGTVDASRKRFVAPIDIVWARLGDENALPPTNLGVTTAEFKANLFILTPKLGYRMVDQAKIKIDALTGFRYWYLGETLEFTPSTRNLNFHRSQNWVDPLVGGRIELSLSPKLAVHILGDVGGWGVGSQLDYQIAGILSYEIKPNWSMQAGYRYLDVDYRGGAVYDMTMSGVLIGITYNMK